MNRQPFTWHGYRFEWTEFDMPHGSKEHYEGWRITRSGSARSLMLALQPDVATAKSILVEHLAAEAHELRKQAIALEFIAKDMRNDL